jgi:putative ABC transport system ATP-binding protein
MQTSHAATVELYWIPLGAGGHSVRLNGRAFEAFAAARRHRRRCDLYHAALVVELDGDRYAIELAPSPDADEASRGVVATGAVGSRHLGRLRPFRYEVRCSPDASIPDLADAVGGPCRLSGDPLVARRLLDLAVTVPRPVWGRDELKTGEMWNSNSVIAWLLAAAGLPTDRLGPPPGGRAPGWAAGLSAAAGAPEIAGPSEKTSWLSGGSPTDDDAPVAPAPLIVSAVHLCRTFGTGEAAVDALVDVSVDFPAGEFTAIMGPSGSGKSTLMHLLAGLDRPTSGTVAVDGTDLSGLDDGQLTRLRRDRLGFVFQGFNLVPVLSAEENILLPLTLAGGQPDRAWFDQLVSTVDIGDRLAHRPSELSGGQQQRVAVARALIHRPAVVFADEPTGNLDSRASAEVLTLLRGAADEFGQTIVMVTHDANAASYADRLVVMADSRIVHDEAAGDAEAVLELMKTM